MSRTKTIRKAAAILRERAEKATPGPWALVWDSCDCGDGYGCNHGSWVHAIRFPVHVQEPMRPGGEVMDHHYQGGTDEIPPETVEYIATLPPAVGLALADWLDTVAQTWENAKGGVTDWDGDTMRLKDSTDSHALTVARAILAS